MNSISINCNIKPRYIFRNDSIHKIIWSDRRFHIYQYNIFLLNEQLDKIILNNVFHPNAKDCNMKSHEVKTQYDAPTKVQLCLPDVFKGRKLKTEITDNMIINLISSWNFDDCYYIPHQHLYECEPKIL